MTTVGKILLGVGVAAIATAIVHAGAKASQNNTTIYVETKAFFKRIKEAAKEKAEKILVKTVKFVSKHQDTIQKLTILVSAVGAFAELFYHMKKLKEHDAMMSKLNSLNNTLLRNVYLNGMKDEYVSMLGDAIDCAKTGTTLKCVDGDKLLAEFKVALV
jgi:hypothetical protein